MWSGDSPSDKPAPLDGSRASAGRTARATNDMANKVRLHGSGKTFRESTKPDCEKLLLVGEVSKVNDDANDNFFLGDVGRFPEIDEDKPPLHYLCTEYPKNA